MGLSPGKLLWATHVAGGTCRAGMPGHRFPRSTLSTSVHTLSACRHRIIPCNVPTLPMLCHVPPQGKLNAHADAGFTTFDTADIYGPSEGEVLGFNI